MSVAHYRKSDGMPQSVREHLEATSERASVFAGEIGIASLGALAGMLHDLGKYSAVFQTYLKMSAGQSTSGSRDKERTDARLMKGKIDHSSAGAQLIWQTSTDSRSSLFLLARQMIALCVASHHSGLIDCLSPDGNDIFSKRMVKPIEPICRDEDERYIQDCIATMLDSSAIEDELQCKLETLKGQQQSAEIGLFMLGLLTTFLFSALIDADRLDTADFENKAAALQRYHGEYSEWASLIEKLEVHLAGLEIRNKIDEIRREVSLACLNFAEREKGLYQLTVPTGGGKTLASLRFALHHAQKHRMKRIIYVVPYTSIIDQNARVARSIFEPKGYCGKQIVLEHHSNLTPEHDTMQSKILAENWDAPVVFTTAVQFLEALFGAGTRGTRRMHQLANAIIIFDEVQTLPIRATHLFNNAINFLVAGCGSTAVFCTATQPLLDKVDVRKGAAKLSPNPQMMSDVRSLFMDLRRVEVIDKRKAGGWTEQEIADGVIQEMKDTGSVLVIVNTKAEAHGLYQRCKGATEHIYHLSTSMCPAHRTDNLDKVNECLDLADPKPVICISTQLIEAGVEVDFGSVVRYLAGIDSIAQAAGRCNRHGRRTTGRVLIVNPSGENLDKLPDIRKAQEIAERVLDEFRNDPAAFDHDLLSPSTMACYYQYYFFERAHEMAYPVSAREINRNDTLLSLLSMNDLSVEAYKRAYKAAPSLYLRQSFHTAAEAFKAIDSPTEGVIVPYHETGERIINELSKTTDPEEKIKLLREAQRYSVNMFPREKKQLLQKRRLYEVWEGSEVYWLDHAHYSEEFGASVEQIGDMKTLIG